MNIYEDLETACKNAGTNMTKLCRAAGVHRSIPTRWKYKTPKTVVLYLKLMAALPVAPLKTEGDEVICSN